MKLKYPLAKLTLLWCSLCWLGSCGLQSLEDPIVIADVEKEFYIDLWEALYPSGRTLQFNVSTIENEDCLNYKIDTDVSASGSSLALSLNSIVPPQDCELGSGPATSSIAAGQLATGFYDFTVSLRNTVVNKGQLEILGTHYAVNMESEAGIIFTHSKLYRIPNNIIWGYIGYENANEEEVANDFINALEQKTNTAVLNNGYFGHFTLTGSTNQHLILREQPTSTNYQTFYYQYTGAEEELRNYVTEFRSMHPETVQLNIYTWQGDKF